MGLDLNYPYSELRIELPVRKHVLPISVIGLGLTIRVHCTLTYTTSTVYVYLVMDYQYSVRDLDLNYLYVDLKAARIIVYSFGAELKNLSNCRS